MVAGLDRLANIPIMNVETHMNGRNLIIDERHVEW